MTASAAPLDPQLNAAFAQAGEIAASLGPPAPGVAGARQHAARGRAYWNEGGPEMAERREARIPGPLREVPVVVYRSAASAGPLPVFVYLHGGGFKLGDPRTNDRQMRELAQAWGGVVVSTDYLHAPEHVFPSAVEEVAAVLQWLHANGSAWGIAGDRVAVGGSSAGAVVAFGALVHLGGPEWVRAGVGIVGAFSDRTDTESMEQYGRAGLFPDVSTVAATFGDYAPDGAMRSDARANVLLAEPHLLPVSFLAAAECDIYREASVLMANHLRGADRLDTLKIYPGMAHLFFGFSRSVDRSAECVRDIAAFLARRLPA